MPARNWNDARRKVEQEGRCRVCGAGHRRLEAAHVLGREHDKPHPLPSPRELANGELSVRADEIVPLCQTCHRAYDAHALDLLPYLSLDEQARAVGHVGIARAYQRTTGSRTPPSL
jgi:hypothetical protein